MNWAHALQNPWFGFIGTAAGIIGVILSILFYLRSRRFAKPCYFRTSMRWFDGSEAPHSDLQLTFRGRQVPRFTITQLVFWNAGNQPIRPADFVKASPFRIECPAKLQLFDAKITAVTAPETSVALGDPTTSEDGSLQTIPIRFDYFDGGDGFILQLIHDGESHRGVRFAGKLPGVSSFRKLKPPFTMAPDPQELYREAKPLFAYTQWAAALFLIALGCLGIWNIYCALFREFHWYQLVAAPLTLFLLVPLVLFAHKRPPKKLYDALVARPTDAA